MKNLLFTLLIIIVSFSSYSQSMVVWLDYHTPVKGKGSELSDAIKDKTKKYNQGACLLYTSPSPRDLSTSRMPSSA